MPEVTKISHGLTIGDLRFGNVKPGVVEATLKPGETMEEALDELDERLNAWHRRRYSHLYQESNVPLPNYEQYRSIDQFPIPSRILPIITKEEPTDQSNDVVSGIQSADSIEKLTTWKLVASQDKELYAMYMKRLKELTNGGNH